SWSDHGFFLLSAAVSVAGATTLEQPREVTVREGDAVTFECTMREDDMSRFYMYWYRQDPRGALEWICRDSDSYGEGFQDRFRGSVDESMNRFTL
ncbi:HVM06 protein, partial [Paradoxornis webbianus]|nr:HVM06 protein [Sinosuthora webbiana]